MSAHTAQISTNETRYGFGENWAEYASHVDEKHMAQVDESLNLLLDDDQISDKDFLDIGCGSGVHALSALRKGAKFVTAVDYDVNSVKTTQAMLSENWKQDNYQVLQGDILNASPAFEQQYDIVYSWGVLHHTGEMWDAINNAFTLVKPGGLFVIALYKETALCGFWKVEKKFYSSLPHILRLPFDYLYAALFLAALCLKGQNPFAYVKDYHENRGMRWMTNVRDWLGGYPYESVTQDGMDNFATENNLTLIKSLNTRPSVLKGLFGTGCAEYVFRRQS